MDENFTSLLSDMREYLESRFDHYLNIFREMVAINSFTSNAEGINKLSAYTSSVFKEFGFRDERIKASKPDYGDHLFLYCNEDKRKSIALVSHLDTVYQGDEEISNNFQYGSCLP